MSRAILPSLSPPLSIDLFVQQLTRSVFGLLLRVTVQQFVALCAPDPGFLSPSRPGVSEADEGQRRTRGTLRHVRGLPGHLRLGALGAAGGRHGVAGGDQVQHHREPEQHQPHLHRLPDLPHHLKHSLKQHLSISGFWGHWEGEMFFLFFSLKAQRTA